MRSSRTDHLRSEVMEPKARATVESVDTVIAIWQLGQILTDLAAMVATTTLLHQQPLAES
jgi:hypothetical protein